jgi:hypothetical protein
LEKNRGPYYFEDNRQKNYHSFLFWQEVQLADLYDYRNKDDSTPLEHLAGFSRSGEIKSKVALFKRLDGFEPGLICHVWGYGATKDTGWKENDWNA